MAERKRYALVGTGGRARFFYEAIVSKYKQTAELVGFCDPNQTRMNYANQVLRQEHGATPVATYAPQAFETMIKKEKPDIVIVTSIDRTHDRYTIRAMELGCDVITEKPMTIDEHRCQAIIDTVKKTGRKLRVSFNYRYAPHNTKLRQLIADNTIGNIYSVHFEWLLDIQHGADYFRRWHRDKRNSGGLLVHKATHHFDLVNFWLATRPETVVAFGDLNFYGRENAETRGVDRFYSRAKDSQYAKNDPFALHLSDSPVLKALYLDAEQEDGYYRDQSVFGDGISIEDTMGVMVRYTNNAIMTYSLNAYMPWEGFRIAFNGNRGRIEAVIRERAYVSAGGDKADEGALKDTTITVFPMAAAPYEAEIPSAEGGHGGGDPVLLNDLLGTPGQDPLQRAASHIDGAVSILTGIAANISIRTGRPVRVADLVSF